MKLFLVGWYWSVFIFLCVESCFVFLFRICHGLCLFLIGLWVFIPSGINRIDHLHIQLVISIRYFAEFHQRIWSVRPKDGSYFLLIVQLGCFSQYHSVSNIKQGSVCWILLSMFNSPTIGLNIFLIFAHSLFL